MSKSPAESAGFAPTEPWDRHPKYAFSFDIGGKMGQNSATTAIGWAVLGLATDQISSGQSQFRPDQTDEQKIAETVTRYLLLHESNGDDEQEVELYRYLPKSYPKSRAFLEGMSHEHHERQVIALKKALQDVGAKVKIRTV